MARQDVPEILMSGHHAKIEEWRFRQGVQRTLERRPDLVDRALESDALTAGQRKICQEMKARRARDGERIAGRI